MKPRFETEAQFLHTGFVQAMENLESHEFIISISSPGKSWKVMETCNNYCFLRIKRQKHGKK